MTEPKPDFDLPDFGAHDEGACEAVRARWVAENRAAMDAWNAYVDAHGLPLAEYRVF